MVAVAKRRKNPKNKGENLMVNPARRVVRDNLVALRKSRGITQRKIATMLGCTQAYICEIETGVRKAHVDLIWEMAAALGVAPHDLLVPGRFKASA